MAELTGSERVACRTPSPDRPGETRIPKWKFDLVRKAILDELGQGSAAFGDLAELVGRRLGPQDLERLGSLGWHVTTVKLELEVRGEIRRLDGHRRQVLALG